MQQSTNTQPATDAGTHAPSSATPWQRAQDEQNRAEEELTQLRPAVLSAYERGGLEAPDEQTAQLFARYLRANITSDRAGQEIKSLSPRSTEAFRYAPGDFDDSDPFADVRLGEDARHLLTCGLLNGDEPLFARADVDLAFDSADDALKEASAALAWRFLLHMKSTTYGGEDVLTDTPANRAALRISRDALDASEEELDALGEENA